MHCPNNEECTIEFTQEEFDQGDPSTPYFSSWTAYIYNETNSIHVEPCTGLSQEQIDQIEKERNEIIDYGYNWDEP